MIALDTNVVSELMKSAPDAAVTRWIAEQQATTLYTTSITQAEVLHGILLLPAGKRRAALETAAESNSVPSQSKTIREYLNRPTDS